MISLPFEFLSFCLFSLRYTLSVLWPLLLSKFQVLLRYLCSLLSSFCCSLLFPSTFCSLLLGPITLLSVSLSLLSSPSHATYPVKRRSEVPPRGYSSVSDTPPASPPPPPRPLSKSSILRDLIYLAKLCPVKIVPCLSTHSCSEPRALIVIPRTQSSPSLPSRHQRLSIIIAL